MSLFQQSITEEILRSRRELAAFLAEGDDVGVSVATGRLDELYRIAVAHELPLSDDAGPNEGMDLDLRALEDDAGAAPAPATRVA